MSSFVPGTSTAEEFADNRTIELLDGMALAATAAQVSQAMARFGTVAHVDMGSQFLAQNPSLPAPSVTWTSILSADKAMEAINLGRVAVNGIVLRARRRMRARMTTSLGFSSGLSADKKGFSDDRWATYTLTDRLSRDQRRSRSRSRSQLRRRRFVEGPRSEAKPRTPEEPPGPHVPRGPSQREEQPQYAPNDPWQRVVSKEPATKKPQGTLAVDMETKKRLEQEARKTAQALMSFGAQVSKIETEIGKKPKPVENHIQLPLPIADPQPANRTMEKLPAEPTPQEQSTPADIEQETQEESAAESAAARAAKAAAMATNQAKAAKTKVDEASLKYFTDLQKLAAVSLPVSAESPANIHVAAGVRELCATYDIQDHWQGRLQGVLARRPDTAAEILEGLWVRLEHAKEPERLLVNMIREIEQDKFMTNVPEDDEVQAFARKHRIDAMANLKLCEVLSQRPDTKAKDLYQLDQRLEWSGTPSALLMFLLTKMVKGETLPSGQQKIQPGSYLDRQDKAKRQKKEKESRGRSMAHQRYRSPSVDRRARRRRSHGEGHGDSAPADAYQSPPRNDYRARTSEHGRDHPEPVSLRARDGPDGREVMAETGRARDSREPSRRRFPGRDRRAY